MCWRRAKVTEPEAPARVLVSALTLQARFISQSLLRGRLSQQLVGPLRLLGTDQAVAIRVDAFELLVGAQELATRQVAVAVRVHLAEPERANSLLGNHPIPPH